MSLDCFVADLICSVYLKALGVTLSGLSDRENARVTGTGMYCNLL